MPIIVLIPYTCLVHTLGPEIFTTHLNQYLHTFKSFIFKIIKTDAFVKTL